MPRKAAVVEEDDGPSKAWLDSYADAMTLLLAFFVLLYAFSLLDVTKFTEFKYGVSQAFSFASPAVPQGSGLLGGGMGINNNMGQAAVVSSSGSQEIQSILEKVAADRVATVDETAEFTDAIAASLAASTTAGEFTVEADPRGVAITLNEKLLFRSGSAQIDPESPSMATLASILAPLDNEVLVEGHTDSVPTNGIVWSSNWELSAARATAVLRVLTERFSLPATRFSAVGHADTRPIASNETADGRQANRRTTLVILTDTGAAATTTASLVSADPTVTGTPVPAQPAADPGIANNPALVGP